MSFFKDKPFRSKQYRDWVKTLPCVLTGIEPAGDCHHVISVGEGGTATKACDLLSFPVTRESHQLFHRLDENTELKLEQWKFVAKTLQKAIKDEIKALNAISV